MMMNIGSVVACMNATINRVPKKYMKVDLVDGAPAG
jgi:hypothetical protein